MVKRRMNHEGSVYEWKRGKWRAQISVDGHRLSYNGKSQRECLDWLGKMKLQVEMGLTYEGAKILLEDFLEDWLISKKASIRTKTLDHYARDVNIHIVPRLGRVRVAELKPRQIQRLYDEKLAQGMGVRSVVHLHSVLRQALNHAIKLGLIPRNPATMTTPPKSRPKEMNVLNEGQVQTFLLAADEYQSDIHALYHLAINTGMRQSELLGLKWTDLDTFAKTLAVRRQVQFKKGRGVVLTGLKTEASNRTLKLGEGTLSLLKKHQIEQANFSFERKDEWEENNLIFPTSAGTPYYSSVLQKRFNRLVKKSGLASFRFHDLRHTAASLMLNHGIPVIVVSRRLGHARPSITLDVYGHLVHGMQEKAAEVMDEIMTPVSLQTAPKLPQKHESPK